MKKKAVLKGLASALSLLLAILVAASTPGSHFDLLLIKENLSLM